MNLVFKTRILKFDLFLHIHTLNVQRLLWNNNSCMKYVSLKRYEIIIRVWKMCFWDPKQLYIIQSSLLWLLANINNKKETWPKRARVELLWLFSRVLSKYDPTWFPRGLTVTLHPAQTNCNLSPNWRSSLWSNQIALSLNESGAWPTAFTRSELSISI